MKKKKVVKGMLIVLLVLAIVGSAGYLYLYNHGLSGNAPVVDAPVDGQIKVACVGDSITYGHGITDWAQNHYPALLQNKLGHSYHVQNFGVSGRCVQDNTDQPYTAVAAYNQSKAYGADILVFMMGTNDSKPENWHGADSFQASLCALLNSYGDTQIILCTPATSFFTEKHTGPMTSYDIRPAIAAEIADIVREVAAERNYPLLDIHELTGQNPQWFEADGVHLSNAGAAAIAQAVAEAIAALA